MRVNRVVFLLCIFLVMPNAFVAAAPNNQGLEWGVDVGDTFDFTFVLDSTWGGDTLSASEEFTLKVTSLPTIPDNIVIYNNFFMFSPTFEGSNASNTTIMGMYSFYTLMAFPVGNWTLISDLYDDIYSSHHLVDMPDIWGIQLSPNGPGWDSDITLHWSMTDGLLNYAHIRTDDPYGDEYYEYTMTRVGYYPEPFNPIILVVAAGGIIALVLIVILLKKR